MHVAELLFVTSVDESHKLICQAPGCGRGIAKSIHVIRDQSGAVRVVGSGCYGKLSGHERATENGSTFDGFDGRRLTPEERASMAADTAAFVASVEARLAFEKEAAQQALEEKQAESDRLRAQRAASGASEFHRRWPDEWNQAGRRWDRAPAVDQLAQFRAQQAREAARTAMQRWPELRGHPLDVVADAMAQAKAQYLARGFRMDAPDARIVIEKGAVALLAERTRRGNGQ